MAVLRYKDENGVYHDIVGINVQNEVVQTTGQSTTAVMSQKAVSDLIPAQASSSNQLADKDFVNSSVSTATATYQGSYNLVSDLSLTTQASHGQIEDALSGEISGADNNDYAFVQIPTSDSTPTEIAAVERYKFNGTRWSFEYTLNNSGFTAAQWAAVNSGITSGLVAKINALSDNPQSSIASLFGMDSSGNFQNISAANLATVLGGVYNTFSQGTAGSVFYLPKNDNQAVYAFWFPHECFRLIAQCNDINYDIVKSTYAEDKIKVEWDSTTAQVKVTLLTAPQYGDACYKRLV